MPKLHAKDCSIGVFGWGRTEG